MVGRNLPAVIYFRHNKSRLVHECPRPVTAIEFKTQGKNIFLFVVTEASVTSINISGKQDVKVGTATTHTGTFIYYDLSSALSPCCEVLESK
jgi:hypothetical protein